MWFPPNQKFKHTFPVASSQNHDDNHTHEATLKLPYEGPAAARGFFRTRITESPLRNILEMNLSLFTGFAFFLPFPVLGSSVHISLTPSSTMLQCLSKAFTRPSSFLLFLQLIRTWVLFFTESVRTLRGPVENSSCSFASLSSGVMSALLAISEFLQLSCRSESSNKSLVVL